MPVVAHDQPLPLAGYEPHVFITLLGNFAATIAGAPAEWSGGGAGSNQLKRALAYLIAHLGEGVSQKMLMEVAGGRTSKSRKHVWNGVLSMLRRWGMTNALVVRDRMMMLTRHPVWLSDTDRLQQLFNMAIEKYAQSHHEQAISLMEEAGRLCGGQYLPLFDYDLDLGFEGDAGYWMNAQKEVFQTIAQWRLERNELGDALKGFQAAVKALRFDRYNRDCCRLAAIAARQLGNEELARRYEDKARR